MQDYINYIIGGLVVLVIGLFIYLVISPENKNGVMDTENKMIMENGEVMNHDEMNHEQNVTATTTTTNTDSNTISKTDTKNSKMKATYMVKMETTKGTIVLELNTNIAPKTVANFTKLAGEGFYNGIKFHRVIKDFMIQGGDPLSKDDKMVDRWGTGGPGYRFEDEITDPATYQNGYKRGILAMANSGPNTNGSQFFIMHKDVPLPPNYTIFGRVVSGLETVDAIADSKTLPNDRPVDNIVITKVTVE